MELDIKGKKALVCASSEGIGKAIALALANEGARLFLCARNKDQLAAVAEQASAAGAGSVHYQSCDLADHDSRESLISDVHSIYGSLDILVHNVGGPPSTTVLDTELSQWEAAFHQLFQSIAHLNSVFIPAMKAQRWGRIVVVTSLSVIEPIPGLALSNAMRSAVTAMSKTLADEVASYNICVNCVAPGLIQTARTEERIEALIKKSGGTRESRLAEFAKSVPAGRLGTAEEFAAVVCFLCSQKASYLTGSTICVDGGKRRSTY